MLKSDIPHAAHQLPSSSVASFCSSGGSSWLLSLCWCSVNYSVHGVLKDRKYPRGSPWLTWLCIVESDLQHANTGLHSVRRCAQDCTVRRWFVETELRCSLGLAHNDDDGGWFISNSISSICVCCTTLLVSEVRQRQTATVLAISTNTAATYKFYSNTIKYFWIVN